MQKLEWRIPAIWLDVVELSRLSDVRAGYGLPTILVDGKDDFGAPQLASHDPACRFYPGGLPTVADIVKRLKVQIAIRNDTRPGTIPPKAPQNI